MQSCFCVAEHASQMLWLTDTTDARYKVCATYAIFRYKRLMLDAPVVLTFTVLGWPL